MSAMVCPLELNCSATGKLGALLLMLRRCSPKLSRRRAFQLVFVKADANIARADTFLGSYEINP